MPEFLFREHSLFDRAIWNDVLILNQYGLTVQFSPEDVILDIGAHIGAFCKAVLDRGAGRVFAVEPDISNLSYLRHNLCEVGGVAGRVVFLSAAVWRSDVEPGATLHCCGEGGYIGIGDTLGRRGPPCPALSFDSLVSLASQSARGGRVRLVKLDCEGAEWPILYTASSFHFVDAFVGEYHSSAHDRFVEGFQALGEFPRPFNAEGLCELFTENGFLFEHQPTAFGLGIFRAWRSGMEF